MMKLVTMALALVLAGGAAQAATCSAMSNNQTITYTVNQGNPDEVMGTQCVSNSNDVQAVPTLNLFGISDWTLGDKVGKNPNDSGGGDNVVTLNFTQNPNLWSVLNPMGYESIMVTIKQANSFGAFLLDTSEALAGIWNTFGPGKSTGDFSHASVWYAGNPAPIPLPAAAALLPLGVASFAMFRRRKSR